MLLRSLQDLVPDELLSAELSDMDAFCLDSALDAASPGLQEAAATLRAGMANKHDQHSLLWLHTARHMIYTASLQLLLSLFCFQDQTLCMVWL